MKTNKVPEKIWLGKYTQNLMLNNPNSNTYVEYIRKDAFIEKACGWIKENITNNPNANSVLVRKGCVTLGMLIEDFKKYMKRE